jgi:hypothetical protein
MKILCLAFFMPSAAAFVPFLDGGSGMPKLYDGWFNEQISKQASTAVSKAIAAGKTKIEVNFPPVPNVDGKKKVSFCRPTFACEASYLFVSDSVCSVQRSSLALL